jgi:hypothetical protein
VLGRVCLAGEPHVARVLLGLGVQAARFLGQLLGETLGIGARRPVLLGCLLFGVPADLLCRPLGCLEDARDALAEGGVAPRLRRRIRCHLVRESVAFDHLVSFAFSERQS